MADVFSDSQLFRKSGGGSPNVNDVGMSDAHRDGFWRIAGLTLAPLYDDDMKFIGFSDQIYNPDPIIGERPKQSSLDFFNKANYSTSLFGTSLEYAPYLLTDGVIRHSYGQSWNSLNCVERMSTISSPRSLGTSAFRSMGRMVGYGSVGVGTIMDGIGVYNWTQNPNSPNAVHPSKFGVNLGVSAYGIWAAPPVAIFYFGAEAGGFFQLWNDYGQAVQGVQNEISPTWRLIPFGPK